MMLTEEERRARKLERNREYARRRRAALAGQAVASSGTPRLTINPDRAATVFDPDTGQTFPANSERGRAWLTRMKA
ncbi:MAG: hypothetical protein ACT4OK_16885 [Gemmobacter sp.]